MSGNALNILIKQYAALSQKKERERQRLVLVETRHPIEEALKAGLTLVDFFALTDREQPDNLPAGTSILYVPEAAMKKLATTDSAPPCIAVFTLPENDRNAVLSATKTPLVIVLDGLQDPGNVGTLIRSAAAFGATGIVMTANTVDAFSPKVIRASAGLVFALPIFSSAKTLNQWLSQEEPDTAFADYQWLVTTGRCEISGNAAANYRDVNYRQPLMLVLGNEGNGVCEDILNHSGIAHRVQPVTIPMQSGVESLNVSISGSVVLAEIAHRRGQPDTGGPT